MRRPKWWPRYERGLGWQLPEWLRISLVPLAVGGLVLLLIGETIAAWVWLLRRLLKGK